jgi:hypothetical protein
MPTVVLWNTMSPSSFAEELERKGYTVWEVLSLSEVLDICSSEDFQTVVIVAGIDREKAREAANRFPTIQLQAATTVDELYWELVNLLPGTSAIQ